ncbi:HemK2/MTQ2 family protein methyltransferase [Streptomyces zagrosensis]|uniref:Release factor glutamine methyltransferase n=1 Tax=Streptomyces zagrosensis TaxID=1042984 RepID=A0A7W9QHS8_9ACTN|nr:HemK2/MTQ2 family protein methyltransferase [Streptomyces zagrosensis]MBB5939913.1 release factor glutamine methyltransferase [Streptomyces zagrosensis]
MLLKTWGVYGPQGDSFLLREALLRASVPTGAQVLDVCTGTGLIALTAARLGALRVRAVDTCYRAVLTARCNARLNRLPIRVEHGDFRSCLTASQRYDVITANPPYVPCPSEADRGRGRARAWNAGLDGRRYVDRLCAMAPELLTEDGMMLIVHSALCEPEQTLRLLGESGLKASIVARRNQPFGPVLTSRATWLADRGLIDRGQAEEELVVIRADRVPSTAAVG